MFRISSKAVDVNRDQLSANIAGIYLIVSFTINTIWNMKCLFVLAFAFASVYGKWMVYLITTEMNSLRNIFSAFDVSSLINKRNSWTSLEWFDN